MWVAEMVAKVKVESEATKQLWDKMKFALPNFVTLLALGFGLTALTYANDGAFENAIGCILIAAVLDACDGRVARKLGTASKFGAELDSLADVICFGAVPAFLMYQWGVSNFGNYGWLMCLCFAGASAIRLARFNVAAEDAAQPSWAKHYFVGVPTPVGAFLALTPIYLANAGLLAPEAAQRLALITLPIVAGLMVSTWPSFSAKAISRKALRLLFLPSLIIVALGLFGLIVAQWQTLSICSAIYLFSLPLSKLRHNKYVQRNT
jgi:CDP-diacylglycerol---serine O-phosphatidyltransferase